MSRLIGRNCPPIGKSRLRNILVVLALATLPAISGCVAYGHGGYAVAPPPAYADHGAAYYYDDVVLVFDSGWNGWAVRGHPHHYYFGDHYYRWRGGRWDRSRHFRRGWNRANIGSVPPRLHRHRGHRRHRHSADDRRDGHREATHERRDGGRDVTRGPRENRREARRDGREARDETTRERRGGRREIRHGAGRGHRVAVRERQQNHRVATRGRQQNQRVAVREREQDHRIAVRRRRSDHRVAMRARRNDHRVVAQPPQEDRRVAAKERRRERRQSVRESREQRHRKGQKKAGASPKAEKSVEEPTEVESAGRHGRPRFQRGRTH